MHSRAKDHVRSVDDIAEFVELVDLDELIVHEERARRISWNEDELQALIFPLSKNTLATSIDSTRFGFRFQVVFADRAAELVADIEMAYRSSEALQVAEAVVLEFASRVAFMAAYPFIRSSIFGSATRLGTPAPLLGLVRQGDFRVSESAGEPSASGFAPVRTDLV